MWELDYREAERQRINAFELWYWRRLLSVPWTARRSNQFILKEISPECSLEGLMLKLKLQCFGHLMWRTDSFEKTVILGKIEGGRRRGQQRMRWLDGTTTQRTWVGVNFRSWWWTGRPDMLQPMGKQRVGHDWVTEVMSPHYELDSHALNQVHSCMGHPSNPPLSQIWTKASFKAHHLRTFSYLSVLLLITTLSPVFLISPLYKLFSTFPHSDFVTIQGP